MFKCTDQLIFKNIRYNSVADSGCPGSGFLPIPDPGANNSNKRGKKFVVLPSFVATKITKLKNILFLNWFKTIFEPTTKDKSTF
jgi:hypothetical protein